MKKILVFILLLTFIGNVFGEYYADIEIFVDEKGETTIFGTSNLDSLEKLDYSSDYTSKKGSIWTLNITTNETFEDFIYTLNLPKYSEINYIKTTPTFRIADEDNRIQIIGTGENKKLVILVQYTIDPVENFFDGKTNLFFFILMFLFAAVLLRFFGFKLRKKSEEIKSEKKDNKTESGKEINFDISILPERQREIIKLLQKEKKLTQKQIEAEMKIPKSSVSRNVSSLLNKKILKKESSGQSNYISLNE